MVYYYATLYYASMKNSTSRNNVGPDPNSRFFSSAGLWNLVSLFSNLCLFVLMPFAYFFLESEGFAGSKKVGSRGCGALRVAAR